MVLDEQAYAPPQGVRNVDFIVKECSKFSELAFGGANSGGAQGPIGLASL